MSRYKYILAFILILISGHISYLYGYDINNSENTLEIKYHEDNKEIKYYIETNTYIDPEFQKSYVDLDTLHLNDAIYLLSLQLYDNISRYLDVRKTIVVTTPVNLDNYNITCPLSRIIEEGISNFFTNRGYTVKELTVRESTILIKKMKGEFALTRDIKLLLKEYTPYFLIVGKYSMISDEELFLSLKIVSSEYRYGISSKDIIIHIPPYYKRLIKNQAIEEVKKSNLRQLKKIEEKKGPISSGSKVLSKDDPDDIKIIQRRLKELGLYTKKVDGIWGKYTQKALEIYKKVIGLRPYDVWDLKTQIALFKDTKL